MQEPAVDFRLRSPWLSPWAPVAGDSCRELYDGSRDELRDSIKKPLPCGSG